MRTPLGSIFLEKVANAELLHNAILSLVSPDLYLQGLQAVDRLSEGTVPYERHRNADKWTSVFSALQVIVNRKTPGHRDQGAAPMVYDLLTCAGTYTHSVLQVRDLGARFYYNPGTVIALCGKVLLHEVKNWEGGERICIAHYMRDNVHQCLGLRRPFWPVMDERYLASMSLRYRAVHGLEVLFNLLSLTHYITEITFQIIQQHSLPPLRSFSQSL